MTNKKAFLEEEIPYEKLEKLGISRRAFLSMPKDLVDPIINGRVSPLIKAKIKTEKGKTTIKIGKNKLVYDDLNTADGEYTIKLISDKIGFVYDKKYAKKNKVEYVPAENAVKAKAYDEDKIGDKNAVFCAVSGFDNYVTAVLPAAFSVYKMPVFKLVIDKESFILMKK